MGTAHQTVVTLPWQFRILFITIGAAVLVLVGIYCLIARRVPGIYRRASDMIVFVACLLLVLATVVSVARTW